MKKTLLLGFLSVLFSGAAFAELAVAYHGKLIAADGISINHNVPFQIEFRLYRKAQPGETTALWGRRMSVRLEADGSFYTELKDSAGTDTGRTSYKSLTDAIASANGGSIFMSLTPVGYGEMLPRKEVFGVYRSETAAIASAADRVEAPMLKAGSAAIGTLNVGGDLKVSESFVSSGGKISNTFDGTVSSATIGMDGGKVVFSDKFNSWQNVRRFSITDRTHVCADTIFGWKYSSAYGAFVIPHPIDTNIHSFGNLVYAQQFLLGDYSPIW